MWGGCHARERATRLLLTVMQGLCSKVHAARWWRRGSWARQARAKDQARAQDRGTHHALDVLTRRVAMLLEGAAGAYDRAIAFGRRQLGDLAPRGGSVCGSVRGGGAPPQLVRWTDSVVGRPGGFDAPLFFVGVPRSAEVTGDDNAGGGWQPNTVIWPSRVDARARLAHPAGDQRSWSC